MPRTALDEENYQLIKAHIIDPDNSPLNPEQQFMLQRITSAARILDKNPKQKYAAAILLKKYPEISRTRAYLDIQMAQKLFNTIHKFDYDFWQTWLINDIVDNIGRARTLLASAKSDKQQGSILRVIEMAHANLIKAVGEKPEAIPDPSLSEKHTFYLMVHTKDGDVKLDYEVLRKLTPATLSELNKSLFSNTIDSEDTAFEIMNS